jgi:hypothetical protein
LREYRESDFDAFAAYCADPKAMVHWGVLDRRGARRVFTANMGEWMLQRVTDLYAHLLPDHLARARNAVNLGPALQTVAMTVATGTETARIPRKTHKRH